MDVGTTFIADSQASEAIKPGKGSFHDPPIAAEPLRRLDPSASNARDDAPPSTGEPAAAMVVCLIGMEFPRTFARTSLRSHDRAHLVQQWLEQDRVMNIRSRQFNSEWDPCSIHNDVVFTAGFSAICWVRSGLLTPLFAGTLALSSAARLQSIRSARPNSSRRT